ncbi:MAG: hypothetical protein A2381_11500 [Bdellovibrionales bacterium RIFOXYB1_FULL_37_110]|nr:MAG: hypothetical protein A2417_11805 [Bdellovibrionales bacterium RIFOXYC1_FULL_37_79]OFZ57316.1 MAG: hypothetical protein A2381_11500 [Bdellovibrionales bacterium RIFOXYB1_FULL_37_110]OFZ62212.1 MAG: hypothetical protein A2577_14050 [Bdellovibrionales bacterium RIFOXYD1_FULL_36_51]
MINFYIKRLLIILLILFPLTCIGTVEGSLEIITASELFNNYLNNKDYVLIDNRPFEKYQAGHIKGAINLVYFIEGDPQNTLTQETLKKHGHKKKIIFYCTGFDRSPNAAKIATTKWKIPSNRILLFKGGISEWLQKGYPIIK